MQATTKDDRTMAMFCHLAGVAGLIIFPVILNVVGPLIVWSMKKDQSWFIDDQGKEAVNFQISLSIYLFIASLTVIVLIGFLLAPAVWLGGVILSIIAALKANEGGTYRYPMTIRFIK
ncbi:MAG TPA: DUF4870 domain-containing protein [Blastocatellia bacterium]|nr:DUF4870 domain-containing protein [Blastocatellia bacterium]